MSEFAQEKITNEFPGSIMKSNHVIYQYKDKKMDLFGWILIFVIITGLFLLSILMILWPIKTIMNKISIWTTLCLLIIPLGGWLGIKIIHYVRDLIWHNNHQTTYLFYEDTIHVDEWKNTYDREPTTNIIRLSSIKKVVIAPYITNEYINKYGSKHVDSSYILYIIHSPDGDRELVKIPFPHNYENINIWLTFFKEQEVTLHFTTEILYSYERDMFTDYERLEQLESYIQTTPLHYSGDWKQQQNNIFQEMNMEHPTEKYKSETYGESNTLLKSIAVNVLLSIVLMTVISIGLIKVSEVGWMSAESLWPIFIMIFIISCLFFFLLRHHLRWYFMLIFVVSTFFFGLTIAINYEESETIAYKVSENILAMAMLFPFVVWIPYFIVKVFRKKLG